MRQALELALDWIQKQPEETPDSKYDVDTRYVVLRELEAALAQPEQEPVATDWSAVHEKLELVWYRELSADEGLDEVQDLISTTPPQRKPLTVDEVWQNNQLMLLNAELGCGMDLLMEVVEAIEAAHGIKE